MVAKWSIEARPTLPIGPWERWLSLLMGRCAGAISGELAPSPPYPQLPVRLEARSG